MSCLCPYGRSDPRCCVSRGQASGLVPGSTVGSILVESHEIEASAQLAKEFNNLRGRVLGLIESWGLPDVQERGAKSTFKSLTYDSQARLAELLGNR